MTKSDEDTVQKSESSGSQIANAIYVLSAAIFFSTAMSHCGGNKGESYRPYHVELDGELAARLSTSRRDPLDIRLDKPIRIQLVDSEGKDIPVRELPEFFKQELDQAGP